MSLATELRAISELLATRELDEDALAEACDLARSLRQRLDGPRRARWYEADSAPAGPSSRSAYLDQSPVRGRLNPVAPPLRIEVVEGRDGSPAIRGHAKLGSAYEGPPHGVHGGWVAALFDDLLGATQGLADSSGVTARLTVRYREVTPIDRDLRFDAWIERQSGRRILAKATCRAGDAVTAEAEGLFVKVDFDAVQRQMQKRAGA